MEKYRNTEVIGEARGVGEKGGGGVGAVGESGGGRIRKKSVKTVINMAVVVRKVKEVVDDERVSVTGDEEELRS